MLYAKNEITVEDILHYFPIHFPYRFIDNIEEVNADYIVGNYTFRQDEFFYKGHFPVAPVTPGAILTEAGAQIGLVAFGMYLLGNELETVTEMDDDLISPEVKKLPGIAIGNYVLHFYLVESEMRFKKVIEPGEKIIVRSEKLYFKLNKIKCKVTIRTEDGALAAKGTLSGMINIQRQKNGK